MIAGKEIEEEINRIIFPLLMKLLVVQEWNRQMLPGIIYNIVTIWKVNDIGFDWIRRLFWRPNDELLFVMDGGVLSDLTFLNAIRCGHHED